MPSPDFAVLIREVLAHEAPVEAASSDARILDATLRLIGEYGERRVTIDDVAATSLFARSTVFRRFNSKDELVARVYQREVSRAGHAVMTAAAGAPDLSAALVAGYGALVDFATGHPVIRRLARVEPEILVSMWRDATPSGLDMIRTLLGVVAQDHGADAVDPDALSALLDLLARLMFGELLMPSSAADGFAGTARDAHVGELVGAFLARTPVHGS